MATGDKRSADVHPMLAHFGADRILMAKALSKGLPIPAVSELHNSADCIGCALGGAHAPHAKVAKPRAPVLLRLSVIP